MNSTAAIGLVADREIRIRLRSRGFRITTALMLLLLVGGILGIKLLIGGIATTSVAFTPQTQALAPAVRAIATSLGQDVTTSVAADRAGAEQQVRAGKVDALVAGTPEALDVVVKENLNVGLQNVLRLLAQQVALNEQITKLHGDPAAVAAAVQQAHFEVTPLEPTPKFDVQRIAPGIVAGVLIYVTLMIWGQIVAQGVVEEKSSRVVELLLAAVRPWQLMAGKVIGIGLVGLIQMALFGVVAAVEAKVTGTLTISAADLSGIVGWLVVWYLLGFLTYALVLAAAGALVSRQEEVAGVVSPILMLVILPYVLGVSVLPADPTNSFIQVLSVIPTFAPTLMPIRIALGGVPVWQLVLSVVLAVALIPALVWLSGRIYRNAVIRSGARVRLRDALRA